MDKKSSNNFAIYMLVNQVACCEQVNACMARNYMNQA